MIDFQPSQTWFNSPPLSFEKELKGKIVLLHLWHFSSVKILEVLPFLLDLQKKYEKNPFALIGVHSPKFPFERDDANLLEHLESCQIIYPVVQDSEERFLEAYRKSFVVIGPNGEKMGVYSNVEEAISQIEEAFLIHQEGLNHEALPPPIPLNKAPFSPTHLAYDQEEKRVFIADSSGERIIYTDREGKLLGTIGSGVKGSKDGSFGTACFNQPHGIYYRNDLLYIADTGNHRIRVADFKTGKVKTLPFDILSPLDLTYFEGNFILAAAGSHQIYRVNGSTLEHLSGSGDEENWNTKSGETTAWSEPSSLTTRFSQLFITDSESSSVRWLDLRSCAAHPLVGGDGEDPQNLHAFGDHEGTSEEVKLSHPMGILWIEQKGFLAVADSFNHQIKKIDPPTKKCEHWLSGFKNPQGMVLTGDGSLLIADTGNHRIQEVDLKTDAVTTFPLPRF